MISHDFHQMTSFKMVGEIFRNLAWLWNLPRSSNPFHNAALNTHWPWFRSRTSHCCGVPAINWIELSWVWRSLAMKDMSVCVMVLVKNVQHLDKTIMMWLLCKMYVGKWLITSQRSTLLAHMFIKCEVYTTSAERSHGYFENYHLMMVHKNL